MRNTWSAILAVFLVMGSAVASEPEKTVAYSVENMTCATCPIVVRKAMQRVDGVRKVEVSLEDESAVVIFDPDVTTAEEIGQAATDAGFPATVKENE